MTIPTPPPALAIRKMDFMAWYAKAAPGEKIEYHRGHLSIDRHQDSSPFEMSVRQELCSVAEHAARLSGKGRLLLAQRRVGDGLFSYLAIVAKKPTGQGSHARPLA